MKPNEKFLKQPKEFWANVRTLSQHLGYTERGTGQLKIPTVHAIQRSMAELELSSLHIIDEHQQLTLLGQTLLAYFDYRAMMLNSFVQFYLMNVNQARATFDKLKADLCPACPIPMNKQKGDMRAEAYFTGIINMLIEAHAEGFPCDFDPRKLTSFTFNGVPLRTLARRVDGAFTRAVDPIAIWEIKEYYYTTTFGSRVADGVYETLLDGMELEELREHKDVAIKYYLMIDDYNTWWNMGKSYLCRIIDMLHMGYVNEVLFGSEVLDRLPSLVKEWVEEARNRQHTK